MVVFAVDIGRRMMEFRGTSLQYGRRTLLSQQCNSISGMARLTSRQGHPRRSGSKRYPDLYGSGPLSQWLFSTLAEAELPVICVETRHMQAVLKAQIHRTDRNDARGIAQMLRVRVYRQVHVKTLRSQKLRMLLTRTGQDRFESRMQLFDNSSA